MAPKTGQPPIPQLLLEAAEDLEQEGNHPFSMTDLILLSWQRHPRIFGLEGVEELHPDSNKTVASLSGAKGLVGRGFFRRIGRKQYTLTEEGKEALSTYRGGESLQPKTHTSESDFNRTASPEEIQLVQRLLGEYAWRQYTNGVKEDISYEYACDFWNLTNRRETADLEAYFKKILHSLSRIICFMEDGLQVFEGDDLPIEISQVRMLQHCHDFMVKKFAVELKYRGAPGKRLQQKNAPKGKLLNSPWRMFKEAGQ